MANDYLGNELSVGDTVVFMRLNYRNFQKGEIKSITAQKVAISYVDGYGAIKTVHQFFNQVIKV